MGRQIYWFVHKPIEDIKKSVSLKLISFEFMNSQNLCQSLFLSIILEKFWPFYIFAHNSKFYRKEPH